MHLIKVGRRFLFWALRDAGMGGMEVEDGHNAIGASSPR